MPPRIAYYGLGRLLGDRLEVQHLVCIASVHLSIFLDAISLDFRPVMGPVTQADFTYSITPDTISITDTTKGKLSVANDIEAVLHKIEYWHQGPIAGFKILYRDEHGVWGGIRWDGEKAGFFALGETDEKKAMRKRRSLPK